MKVKHVENCSLPSWYPDFKNVTIKSRILDIPDDFLEYLCSDGTLVLPQGSLEQMEFRNVERPEEETNWDEGASAAEAECPSFPDFESCIKSSIAALGGKVFPKLNWSAPKDASWIASTNTLCCSNPGEVYLLLKSSEFVTHDLTEPFAACEDYDASQQPAVKYQLILRRWHELNPGGEFRVFVRGNKISAICQRHSSSYYHFIGPNKDSIVLDILNFFNRSIKGRFPDADYVFDVYRKDKGKVHLVDFNPFGSVTDSLMFTWEELTSNTPLTGTGDERIISDLPAFRYVVHTSGVQPSPYMMYGMPQDFLHLSTGADPLKLLDFLQLKVQSQNEDDSSSDEETDAISPAGSDVIGTT